MGSVFILLVEPHEMLGERREGGRERERERERGE
jgi:hypothetical protein